MRVLQIEREPHHTSLIFQYLFARLPDIIINCLSHWHFATTWYKLDFPSLVMASAERFNISVPDSKLELLRQKLAAADFPDELEDVGWDYGAPLADVKRLATYWRDEYDWRKQEAKLNELPNFQTSIPIDGFETLSIHFLHQKSTVDGAIPLLFCHGWPGSFLEVTKILPCSTLEAEESPPSTSSLPPSQTLASPPEQVKRVSASRSTPKPATDSCSRLATTNMVLWPLPFS